MLLREAVSEILSRNVTNEEAKEFACNQYGVLCAFIRSEAFKHIIKEKIGEQMYFSIVNEKVYDELMDEDLIVESK